MENLSYFKLYLEDYIKGNGITDTEVIASIEDRAESAAVEYERSVKNGLSPSQARELAMATLMDGLNT